MKFNNNLNKIITLITVMSLIASCSVPKDNTGGAPDLFKTNGTCTEPAKSFVIASLNSLKKPNEAFRIKILLH